jgi:uncharacterized membrane protein
VNAIRKAVSEADQAEITMDKMLVAIFESERQATVAAGAMKDLCGEGVLLVYAFALIVRDAGKISIVNSTGEDCSDPVLGAATRKLIKLFGQRLGAVEAANSRAIADPMMEMARIGVDASFLDEVARRLLPGKAAIVAEIEDQMPSAMDTLLQSQDGIVFRCARLETVDIQIAEELNALHGEIQTLEKQVLQTLGGSRAQLQGKLDLARARLQTMQDGARRHAASIKREAEAKIASLQERAAKSDGGIKTRLERLADEVRVDYVNRATKLNLAWKFAGNVLMLCLLLSVFE